MDLSLVINYFSTGIDLNQNPHSQQLNKKYRTL